jgi:hypothetical protein
VCVFTSVVYPSTVLGRAACLCLMDDCTSWATPVGTSLAVVNNSNQQVVGMATRKHNPIDGDVYVSASLGHCSV